MAEDLKGKVLTVLGPIAPSDVGIALSHEHLLVDSSSFYKKNEYGQENYENLDFKIGNLGKIRQFPFSVRENIAASSKDDIISELCLFKQAGGSTVVDVTTVGLRSCPQALPEVSRKSGVNVITGTGYYVDGFLPEQAKKLTVNEMVEVMEREIHHGIGSSGVRCGVIGEVGCSFPLRDSEKRSLQAAALVQTKTGAPLIIHPGRDPQAPFEIISILESFGADTSRTVMSHLDRSILDRERLLEFAKMGCIMEYDLFGMECSHYQMCASVDMPSDAQRIGMIKTLVDHGYSDRIVIAHDVHTKHRLACYGGHGFAHILENIAPKMVDRDIDKATVDKMLIENTRNWLTFK